MAAVRAPMPRHMLHELHRLLRRALFFVGLPLIPLLEAALRLDRHRAHDSLSLLRKPRLQRLHPGKQRARALPEDDRHPIVR